MEEQRKLKFLDCSLRDGGYYTSWDFDPTFVESYFSYLNQLPVDYIELGYRSKPRSGYYGPYFYCPEVILEKAKALSTKKLAIILNEKEIEPADLPELLHPCKGIVGLVRIAVAPDHLEKSFILAQKIKTMGFEVSLNLMYLSKWESEKTIIEEIKKGEDYLDYLYLVDSYGGIFPDDLKRIIGNIRSATDLKLGFHAHNNLELAFINTLTAIESGVEMVDATVLGMGRGAGNLKTELLLPVLQNKGFFELDYDQLSRLVNLFSDLQEKYRWGTNLAYVVSGVNSLPQQEVMSRMNKRFYSLNSIVRGVYNQSRGVDDNLKLKEFSPDMNCEKVLIVGGGPSATIHSGAIISFLKRHSNSCIIHTSSKNAAAFRSYEGLQVHCLSGNEGHRLEEIYLDLEGTYKMAVLPPFPRAMGTYIPEPLKENASQIRHSPFLNSYIESVTALAIETAVQSGAKELFFVGYDGYEGKISKFEMELFQENEKIFEELEEMEIIFCALTQTKYSRLPQESVFAYL